MTNSAKANGPRALILFLFLSSFGACGSEDATTPVDTAALEKKRAEAERWMERGIYQKALPAWQEVVEASPDDWEARFQLGRTFMAYGDRFSAAAEQLAAAAEIAPEQAKIHRQLGIARRYLGSWIQARDAFETALRLQPDHARAQALLGLTLLELEDWEGAKTAFAESRRLEPQNVDAIYGAGELHRRRDRLSEATVDYRAALVADPYHLGSRWQLGLCLRDLGESESAQRHLKIHRLINSLSDNVVDRTRPELDRFQRTLESILALEPENWRALEDLGAVLEAREDPDAARERYRAALQIHPNASRAQQALERLGQ